MRIETYQVSKHWCWYKKIPVVVITITSKFLNCSLLHYHPHTHSVTIRHISVTTVLLWRQSPSLQCYHGIRSHPTGLPRYMSPSLCSSLQSTEGNRMLICWFVTSLQASRMLTMLNKLLQFIHSSLQQDVSMQTNSQVCVCVYHCVQLSYGIQNSS